MRRALAFLLAAWASAAAAEPVSFGENGLVLAGPDERAKFTLGGRAHFDAGGGRYDDRTVRDVFDRTAEVRRGRIEPTLTLGDLTLGFGYDFVDRRDPVKDLFASYAAGRGYLLTFGNIKEPFSLEELTSNNDITFMERALPSAFAPNRTTGFAVGWAGAQATVSAGVFGGSVNESVDRGGIAGIARATFAPILDGDRVLHLGLAASLRELDGRGWRGAGLSFATTPESNLFGVDLLDTGTLDEARRVTRLGLEAAYADGPVRIQGEFVETRVERAAPLPALGFRGGYVQASFVLNGRGAPYKLGGADVATQLGVFGRVEPEGGQRLSRGGAGVFELTARASTLDLADRDTRGGAALDATLGLNWYPEPNVRLMANYVRSWIDEAAPTGRDGVADIVQARLQIAF